MSGSNLGSGGLEVAVRGPMKVPQSIAGVDQRMYDKLLIISHIQLSIGTIKTAQHGTLPRRGEQSSQV